MKLHQLIQCSVVWIDPTPVRIGRRSVVRERRDSAVVCGEVHDHIGAFTRRQQNLVQCNRGWQKSAIAADLLKAYERRYIPRSFRKVEEEIKEAGVGAVQQAQAITARFDSQIWVHGSVNDWKFAK